MNIYILDDQYWTDISTKNISKASQTLPVQKWARYLLSCFITSGCLTFDKQYYHLSSYSFGKPTSTYNFPLFSWSK
jgi:hypothetical protein